MTALTESGYAVMAAADSLAMLNVIYAHQGLISTFIIYIVLPRLNGTKWRGRCTGPSRL